METAVAEIGVQKYEEYKESGVDWIGEVPAHWLLLANKFIFKLKKTEVGKRASQYTLLSLTLNGIIKRDMENPQGKFPAEFDTYQEVNVGDFVFCLFDVEETPRTVGLSQHSGMITGAYTVMECLQGSNPLFLYYYYLNLDSRKQLKFLYKGLRNTIPKDAFFSLKTFVPPLAEQTAIADFLDCRTAQIDQAIAQKERLIELLQERRQILIQRAVTRGLNPDAPMKDSGVEWIGEIPAHWEVKKLKFVVQILKRIANATGLDVLSITQRGIKVKDIESGEGQIALDYSKYQLLFRGEFAMNHMDLLTGYVDISNFNGVVSPDYRVFNLVNPKFDKFYLLKVFQLCYKCKVFYAFGQGVSQLGRWRFPAENFNDFIIPEPPHNEQQEISRTIDRLELALKKPVDLAELQIKKLREYKSTLINAAVTGKIKVC